MTLHQPDTTWVEPNYFVESDSPTFFCKPRRKKLELETCLTDYMNANAFGKSRSVCMRCPYGHKNRARYASE